MSAKDKIHDAIKNALIKDGWIITHDPFTIEYKDEYLYADLAAERPLAAERGDEKIIVEIKSFTGPSAMHDFKIALGQFMIYLSLLTEIAPEYELYLAVTDTAYYTDFQRAIIQFVVRQNQLRLIVVNVDVEEIVTWIK